MVVRANRPRTAQAGASECRSFVVLGPRLLLQGVAATPRHWAQGAPNIAVQ